MGVLKVNVGSVAVPDWRKIGCGGAAPVNTAASHDGQITSATKQITSASGVGVGDLMLWFLSTRGATATTPTGWALVHSEDATGPGEGQRGYLFSRTADSSDAGGGVAYSVVLSGNDNCALHLLTFADASAVVAAGGNAHRGNTTSITAESVTAPGADRLLVFEAWNSADYGLTSSPGLTDVPAPAGMTEVGAASSDAYSLSKVFAQSVAAGATGTRTSTFAGSKLTDVTLSMSVAVDTVTPSGGTSGRLKLWDGTRWVREKCTADSTAGNFADTFTRGDSSTTLGAPWHVGVEFSDAYVPVWGVASGKARMVQEQTPGEFTVPVAYVDAATGDIDLTATFSTVASTAGIVFRGTAGGAYWKVLPGQLIDPGGTQRRSWTAAVSGDVMRVVANGTAISVYKNGVQMATTFTSSTNLTGTRCGLYAPATATAARWDDFTLISLAAVIAHPLKVWDGSAWQTVACMVPA